MKIALDFFPILLFFAAFKFYDIYVGTAVLMVATLVQMAAIYAIDRKLQTLHVQKSRSSPPPYCWPNELMLSLL